MEADTQVLHAVYEICLLHGCEFRYTTMIECNVTVRENTVRKSPETKQSQRAKHEHCDKLAGSSSSPSTLRATLGEHTHAGKYNATS